MAGLPQAKALKAMFPVLPMVAVETCRVIATAFILRLKCALLALI